MRTKVKFGITKTADNFAALELGIRGLLKQEVMVGVPENKSHREGGGDNALLAYVHDQGSPSQNIPARPFLIPGIRSVSPQITERLKKLADRAFSGNVSGLEDGMRAIGMLAVKAVQTRILEGPFAPLAKSTIARRLRMNRGTAPLNVSGQLRQAISFYLEEL